MINATGDKNIGKILSDLQLKLLVRFSHLDMAGQTLIGLHHTIDGIIFEEFDKIRSENNIQK